MPNWVNGDGNDDDDVDDANVDTNALYLGNAVIFIVFFFFYTCPILPLSTLNLSSIKK